MLVRRLWRWPNNKSTLVSCVLKYICSFKVDFAMQWLYIRVIRDITTGSGISTVKSVMCVGGSQCINGYEASNLIIRVRMKGVLGHVFVHTGQTGPREPPEDGEMNQLALPSYRIWNISRPGGLMPRTLPHGHGTFHPRWPGHVRQKQKTLCQYGTPPAKMLFRSGWENLWENLFLWNPNTESEGQTLELWLDRL